MVTLESISEFIRNGASIKQEKVVSGLPITRIETIAERKVNLKKCGYASVKDDEYKDYRLLAGDILISHINSEKHLGKCAIFEDDRNDIIHGMNLLCLRPIKDKIFPKYLFHFLSSPVFLKLISSITKKSVNQASFTVTAFKSLEIPLPSLSEQKRIAAILDKADGISQKREQANKLADVFLHATFLEIFGDPVKNPKGWKKYKIKEGVLDITSGWSASGENIPCKSGEFGVLKISSVTSGVFKAEENKVVDSKNIPASKKLVIPKKGDLLFSRANTRTLVAAICMVHQDYNNLFLPDKLWSIKLNHERLLPEFFLILIQNEKVRELLTKQATGTSGSMLNISKSKFEETEIIFPEIDIQKYFCNAFIKTINLKEKLIKSSDLANKSFNSLFQKVFQK